MKTYESLLMALNISFQKQQGVEWQIVNAAATVDYFIDILRHYIVSNLLHYYWLVGSIVLSFHTAL